MLLNISKVLAIFCLLFLSLYISDIRGRSMTRFENRNQTESNTTQEEAGNVTVTVVEPDECDEITCKNGGTCTVKQGKPVCDCPDGRIGRMCEVSLSNLCSQYKPKCGVTGGSCILDENFEVQCVCPEGTEYNHGCYAPNQTCSHVKPFCEETGGSCAFDKYARFLCICPNGTQYGHKNGCITEENLCSINKPYCEETGGICVSDEDQEIHCECPGENLQKKFFVDEIGCQTVKDACSYMKPNCSETRGTCIPKEKTIDCHCIDEDKHYTHGIGCHDDSGRVDSSYEEDDPWDIIYPRNNEHECLNGGKRYIIGKTFKCICKKPFTGKFCENDSCGGKECDCPDGYIGSTCEIRLEYLCSEYKPKCAETGGSCIIDKNKQIQCMCPEGTEYNLGCHAANKTCSNLKPLCEETGGYCTFDKYARFVCMCPNGTQYGRRSGCMTKENLCSQNKPHCEETGGICVSDEHTEIQCECPRTNKVDFLYFFVFEKIYGHEIGCQDLDYLCSKLQPNCLETGGACIPDVKPGEMECICLNGKDYIHGTGYNGTSILEDLDDDKNVGDDPWDKDPWDDRHKCLNGGQIYVVENTFKCKCKEPYTGEFCEIDPCKNNPCLNNGICYVSGSSFTCKCQESFSGKLCEEKNSVSASNSNSKRRTIIFAALGVLCLVGMLTFLLIYCRPKVAVHIHQQSSAPVAVNPLDSSVRN